MLSLLQDSGRLGQHRIGLTTGGPLDRLAMGWANRLVSNPAGATAIEASFGGLKLEASINSLVAVCGGDQPLAINGEEKATWRSHRVEAGDIIELGFASKFCRSYLAVHGGFEIASSFGSASTVPREGIGGLDGGKLKSGDQLPATGTTETRCLAVPADMRTEYEDDITVRVIPGYQQHHFPRLQQRRFFSSEYRVTDRADRMGYRLEGPEITCEVDRQTIGGYPKIGSALSLDTAKLSQLMPGARVRFEAVTPYAADNIFHLARSLFHRMEPEAVNE